jgi:hypothetical protein
MNCDRTLGEICGECSNCLRILQADLTRDPFVQQFAEREKLPAANYLRRWKNPPRG